MILYVSCPMRAFSRVVPQFENLICITCNRKITARAFCIAHLKLHACAQLFSLVRPKSPPRLWNECNVAYRRRSVRNQAHICAGRSVPIGLDEGKGRPESSESIALKKLSTGQREATQARNQASSKYKSLLTVQFLYSYRRDVLLRNSPQL